MQPLNREQYDIWRADAQILEKDGHGEKVLRLADGTFLKLFRRKSWLSKTAFYSPAKRFADNAAELQRLGIPCPRVIQLYRMSDPYRSVVHYEPLAGETLRQLLEDDTSLDQLELFARLAEFITHLHDLGVYFRSLHMGNIVLTPDNKLGLIDISDMRCLGRPLPRRMRDRNYQHLLRYESDWALVNPNVGSLFRFNSR
ncbi:toluene tolerance protein [Pseudomonas sp. G11-1]|uniref:Toluene tolerance protein n=1 Tax=Halopseudomonas bauzanensis TaxID=653930 RepID=A0A4U0YLW9_9GAMM|nr:MULTISPECIES: lipopolysaccharide kinase InaA family protein [Halopseudomonas]MCO5786546.1 toluene tolerance protein [Pseudomonas sp. G11-1]MCO5789772.1 toluene tolerance protein [Pseudomonas sp. G11-2]EZQ18621.1 toluene tolerance protein [Halopseudomonas bauzanensis]TKA92308.1 toluene tolerance protein [Halopseudomonas bauzanensis]WGK62557.1 lipopolysaccharide kinase InaA family protein [Halopseudomonas sp. SMJS2]